MTDQVTITGAARDDQGPGSLVARFIEAAVAKDEDAFKACLAENSRELISTDQMALEGNTVTIDDIAADGELFIVRTTATDEKSSEDFTFVVRKENDELRIDMQATMERAMGV
jgi:hypothetical protein